MTVQHMGRHDVGLSDGLFVYLHTTTNIHHTALLYFQWLLWNPGAISIVNWRTASKGCLDAALATYFTLSTISFPWAVVVFAFLLLSLDAPALEDSWRRCPVDSSQYSSLFDASVGFKCDAPTRERNQFGACGWNNIVNAVAVDW